MTDPKLVQRVQMDGLPHAFFRIDADAEYRYELNSGSWTQLEGFPISYKLDSGDGLTDEVSEVVFWQAIRQAQTYTTA
ncbi:hypothetical protein [Leucobacter iarius]|uniref:Uncharacterized protein n=1 Tax=Leucobacter iarius TaxID=333963 RepID=A0ABP4Y095_9MICO